MNDRTTSYSDREIVNRWVVAEIGSGVSRILPVKEVMLTEREARSRHRTYFLNSNR